MAGKQLGDSGRAGQASGRDKSTNKCNRIHLKAQVRLDGQEATHVHSKAGRIVWWGICKVAVAELDGSDINRHAPGR